MCLLQLPTFFCTGQDLEARVLSQVQVKSCVRVQGTQDRAGDCKGPGLPAQQEGHPLRHVRPILPMRVTGHQSKDCELLLYT